MHVAHNVRPFVNRMRYAPEVASKPDRLEKDLADAKKLASILEAEAAALRKMKVKVATVIQDDSMDGSTNKESNQEKISAHDDINDPDDQEPMENGSDAVDRRIEKIMGEQGLVDIGDEKAYSTKKVSKACAFDAEAH